MEKKDIRLLNLTNLSRAAGRAGAFCKSIDMNPSYYSQLKNGNKGAINGITDALAKNIEEKLGLAPGYLDILHQDPDALAREPVVIQEPPQAEPMAIAYAIEAFPDGVRKALKNLVFQVSEHCVNVNREELLK